MKALRQLFLVAFLLVLAAASARAATEIPIQDLTALDVIEASPSLSIAAKAISAAGLADTFASGNVTLFVPTDDAFAALPRGVWEDLMQPANAARLSKVVKYWIVQGTQRSSDLHSGPIATLAGSSITFNADTKQDELWYGSARVIQRDVMVKNGVMFVTEKVALPPDV